MVAALDLGLDELRGKERDRERDLVREATGTFRTQGNHNPSPEIIDSKRLREELRKATGSLTQEQIDALLKKKGYDEAIREFIKNLPRDDTSPKVAEAEWRNGLR